MQNAECLICKEKLVYLDVAEQMECELCKKVEVSNCRCANGHYVCSECHMSGMDSFLNVCLHETSKNPIEILHKLMKLSFCHMHGPEHHVLVGASLLTAFKNAGGEVDLQAALIEMQSRGRKVPGGICGLWGSCGAAVSTGICMSILTGSSPLSNETWGWCNEMTSRVLAREAKIGGPRCCKRNSRIAILEAIDFIYEKFEVELEKAEDVACEWLEQNNQCIKERCPFYKNTKKKVAFICVHNSCRSQIAEALGKHLAADVFESYSAGTETKPQINQDAVRIMKELYGIDMEETQYSKLISDIPKPDVAISMGCNVSCPFVGRPFDDNWGLEDPTGKSDEEFKIIIKEIEKRILQLKEERTFS